VFLFYIGFHIERKTHFFYIFMERIKKTHFFYIFMERIIFINVQKEMYQIPELPLKQEIETKAVLK